MEVIICDNNDTVIYNVESFHNQLESIRFVFIVNDKPKIFYLRIIGSMNPENKGNWNMDKIYKYICDNIKTGYIDLRKYNTYFEMGVI